MQVKLLRLLQEREFERLGGTQTLKVDVRFVAATHQPLEEMVKQREFREDLFYRLNVVPIWIPPLRARAGGHRAAGAPLLPAARRRQRPARRCRSRRDALALLRPQPWPGNVRQLQNFIERLVVLVRRRRLTAADVERELARQSPVTAPPAAGAGGAAGRGHGRGHGRARRPARWRPAAATPRRTPSPPRWKNPATTARWPPACSVSAAAACTTSSPNTGCCRCSRRPLGSDSDLLPLPSAGEGRGRASRLRQRVRLPLSCFSRGMCR